MSVPKIEDIKEAAKKCSEIEEVKLGVVECTSRMAEFLSIPIPGPNRKLRKIDLYLNYYGTTEHTEILSELAKLSQNTESISIHGGLLTKGAFRQFGLVNKALNSI